MRLKARVQRIGAITTAIMALSACFATTAPVAKSRSRAVMSCGEPTSMRYLSHPRNCSYTFDGSEAHRVTLHHLRWHHWGSRRAIAWGMLKDNHDQDNNGFQSHRVRVVVFGLQAGAYGNRRFYYKMRVSGVNVADFGDYGYIPLTVQMASG